MKYSISSRNPASQLLNITLELTCKENETVSMQLPSWRPGRYEIANYAQYIKSLTVSFNDEEIKAEKWTKDKWSFRAGSAGTYQVRYTYYARQMDAGGSWLDPTLMYVNFINLIFDILNRQEEKIKVRLHLPSDYQIATALPAIGHHTYLAQNFQHLVDSPFMASTDMRHEIFHLEDSSFHVWLQGEIQFDTTVFLNDLRRFTEKQIKAFGEFPAKDYHFLIHLLPYKHYHGVEHRYSTVITIGPAMELSQKSLYKELVGVCSHELYHFWNVCRIRPRAISPYDFSKEAYLDAGFIAEGITTYMGDLFLLKSGFFALNDYLKQLCKMINREFGNFGWQNQSIVESSWDLWLDGYKPGVPDKKVSIYNRGALIALCLDLFLMDFGTHLQEVMNIMWRDFGKPEKGYTMADFENMVLMSSQGNRFIPEFFRKFIYGKEDIFPFLSYQLKSVAIEIHSHPRKNPFESLFGIIHDKQGVIVNIHPQSEAYRKLMVGDKVTTYTMAGDYLQLEIIRLGKSISLQLEAKGLLFYRNYELKNIGYNHKQQLWMS